VLAGPTAATGGPQTLEVDAAREAVGERDAGSGLGGSGRHDGEDHRQEDGHPTCERQPPRYRPPRHLLDTLRQVALFQQLRLRQPLQRQLTGMAAGTLERLSRRRPGVRDYHLPRGALPGGEPGEEVEAAGVVMAGQTLRGREPKGRREHEKTPSHAGLWPTCRRER